MTAKLRKISKIHSTINSVTLKRFYSSGDLIEEAQQSSEHPQQPEERMYKRKEPPIAKTASPLPSQHARNRSVDAGGTLKMKKKALANAERSSWVDTAPVTYVRQRRTGIGFESSQVQ